MVMRLLAKHGPAIALAATLLAGCGIAPPTPQSPAPPTFRSEAQAQDAQAALGDVRGMMSSEHAAFIASLKLTDAQKAAFKALISQKLQARLPVIRQHLERLRDLLQATPFDPEALRTFLLSLDQECQDRLPDKVATLGQFRAILSPEQQASASSHVASMTSLSPQKRAMMLRFATKVAGELQLTTQQLQDFDALQTRKLEYLDRMMAAVHPAVGLFIRDGDQAALLAALRSAHEAPPFDQGVAFLATLSPEQRAKLVKIGQDLIQAHMPLIDAFLK